MRAAFTQIPGPLQKQILVRLGLGALFFILLISLLITGATIYMWLPCAGAALFFASAAFALFRMAVLGDYVAVSGICQSIGLTAARRRVKYVVLQAEDQTIRVTLRDRRRRLHPGEELNLYLAKKAPIYEKDGVQLIYTYLAIDVKGGTKNVLRG
jgi:hypothetical protein